MGKTNITKTAIFPTMTGTWTIKPVGTFEEEVKALIREAFAEAAIKMRDQSINASLPYPTAKTGWVCSRCGNSNAPWLPMCQCNYEKDNDDAPTTD